MKTQILMLAAALIVGTVLPARATDDKTARKAIEDGYARYARDFKRKDLPAVMDLLTPDFSLKVSASETLNRRQTETALKELFSSLESVRDMRIRIESLTADGDTATVVNHERTTGTTRSGEERPAEMVIVERYREIWTRTPQGWRLKHAELLSSQVTLDGKVVPPEAPAGEASS